MVYNSSRLCFVILLLPQGLCLADLLDYSRFSLIFFLYVCVCLIYPIALFLFCFESVFPCERVLVLFVLCSVLIIPTSMSLTLVCVCVSMVLFFFFSVDHLVLFLLMFPGNIYFWSFGFWFLDVVSFYRIFATIL